MANEYIYKDMHKVEEAVVITGYHTKPANYISVSVSEAGGWKSLSVRRGRAEVLKL